MHHLFFVKAVDNNAQDWSFPVAADSATEALEMHAAYLLGDGIDVGEFDEEPQVFSIGKPITRGVMVMKDVTAGVIR